MKNFEIITASNVSAPAYDLTHLIDFQLVIMEMQMKVVELRKKKADERIIEKACSTIDKLISIYERFDRLYFNVNFHIQKNHKLQKDLIELQGVVVEQQREIEKLQKSLEWK